MGIRLACQSAADQEMWGGLLPIIHPTLLPVAPGVDPNLILSFDRMGIQLLAEKRESGELQTCRLLCIKDLWKELA